MIGNVIFFGWVIVAVLALYPVYDAIKKHERDAFPSSWEPEDAAMCGLVAVGVCVFWPVLAIFGGAFVLSRRVWTGSWRARDETKVNR